MMVAWFGVVFTSIAVKRKGGRLNTLFHAWSMVSAALLTLMGYYVIHTHKDAIGKPHLKTYHSWTGIVVIVMTGVGVVGSMAAFHPDSGRAKTNRTARFLHKATFRTVTVLSLVTILSGWYKLASLGAYAYSSTIALAAFEVFLALLLLSPVSASTKPGRV